MAYIVGSRGAKTSKLWETTGMRTERPEGRGGVAMFRAGAPVLFNDWKSTLRAGKTVKAASGHMPTGNTWAAKISRGEVKI